MKDFNLTNYEPKNILKHFAEICKIPHISLHEKQLSDYLYNFFKQHGCEVIQDRVFNLIIKKPASKGYEDRPSILFQGHMDMVGSVAPGKNIDMLTTSVIPYIENGWIHAQDTSLGMDNGGGIAIMMELFSNNSIKHGPLEGIITVAEEESTYGVDEIKKGAYKSKYNINLDTDGKNEIIIASAGGKSFVAIKKCKLESISNQKVYSIKISHLDGGHSGSNIYKQHINAIKFIGEALLLLAQDYEIRIIEINGGSSQGAIPTQCEVIVAINCSNKTKISDFLNNFFESYKVNLDQDHSATIEVKTSKTKYKNAFSLKDSTDIIDLISLTINGEIIRDRQVENVMYLSNNLGIISTSNNEVKIKNMTRSFNDQLANLIVIKNKTICKKFGFTKFIEEPGDSWDSWVGDLKTNSIAKHYIKLFKKLHNIDLHVSKTPGGLEVVDIIKKNPIASANSISIGINNLDFHSYNERTELISIQQLFETLVELLRTFKGDENE